MANWLSRATDAFRKPPPPAPEPYSIRCDCGRTVAGNRVPAAQRPSCPGCGRQVFILPVNVYPVSKKKKPKPPVETESTPEVVDAAPKTRKPDRPQPPSSSKPVPEPQGILLESKTRLLTPFRLIVAAIAVIGSLTGWGLWHRHRIESAKTIVQAAQEAGMKALQAGDFAVAARELGRARDAVDLLGRTDPDAKSIRRNSREATAANDLSDFSLFDVLSEFAQSKSFASRQRSRWILLDAAVINPDQSQGACELDMPLLLDGMSFRIEIDSKLVREAARQSQEAGLARVIFAAQISDIRLPADKEPTARVVLDGKSAFLWTTLETYGALGFGEDREEQLRVTRQLLDRQLELSEASK